MDAAVKESVIIIANVFNDPESSFHVWKWSLCHIDYTEDNRLLLDRELLPIYECHDNCACHNRGCGNRAFAKSLGNLPSVRILLTAEKGFGVFAEDDIPQGTIVMEYVGEVLRRSVAEDRIRSRSDSQNYMLEVRENYANVVLHTYIDATYYGNESRFVNHSCDPNCTIQIVEPFQIATHRCRFALLPFSRMWSSLPYAIYRKEKKSAFIMGAATLFRPASVIATPRIARATCHFPFRMFEWEQTREKK